MWYYGTFKARLYAPYRFYAARHIAANVDAIMYVTHNFLPRRYPSSATIKSVISNVEIADMGADILQSRLDKIAVYGDAHIYKIGLIGSVSNALKGIDTAIRVCADMKKSGFDRFELHILGTGDAAVYQGLVTRFGLERHVFFDGIRPSGEPVYQWLHDMDMYIQPSLQEGLPRAVIEAMSLALPVIGSNAGGMAELLDADYMIRKKDNRDLMHKIMSFIHNPDEMAAQSRVNFNRSKAYSAAVLEPKRDDFWGRVASRVLRCRPM